MIFPIEVCFNINKEVWCKVALSTMVALATCAHLNSLKLEVQFLGHTNHL